MKIITFLAAILIATQVFAQRKNGDWQMTPEESYQGETTELLIIREFARAEGKDLKMLALDRINEAIAKGVKHRLILDSLAYMGGEGVTNQSRIGEQVLNSFPSVRARAAESLGRLNTPEATEVLLGMCRTESDSLVLMEIFRALGAIGINQDGESAKVVGRVLRRFDVLYADNVIALTAMETFEKLAAGSGGLKDDSSLEMVKSIMENQRYNSLTRRRAREALERLLQYEVKGTSSI